MKKQTTTTTGGTTASGEVLAIGRAKHLTYNIVGWVQPTLKLCSVGYGGTEFKYPTCEILCCSDQSKLAWFESRFIFFF